MWFEIIYFTTRGSDRFRNSNWFSTETTKCFSTIFMHPCNQPGIDNKSSNFIPEMVSCLEIKIQGVFFAKKYLRFNKHRL